MTRATPRATIVAARPIGREVPWSPVSEPVSWTEQALAALTHAGYRRGAARAAVVRVLDREECALGVREIDDRLREGGQRIGLASVYRVLGELERLGLVTRVDVGDGSARYEAKRADHSAHHHHLVCGRCGTLTPFSDPALERAITRLAKQIDFEVQGHEILLHGACSGCTS